MYAFALPLHSLFRWLVLVALLLSITVSIRGILSKKTFSKSDNKLRHWTATTAHIQLIIGILLYLKSPIVSYFFNNKTESSTNWDPTFYGVVHISLMILAIVMITIGSAKAKRQNQDLDKFKTMLLWYSVGLMIILIAIPWPFSPLANRPLIRPF